MKLSESGKLFYQEYDLLLDAKFELDKYLNDVIRKSKVILGEFIDLKRTETACELELNEFSSDNEKGRVAIQVYVSSGNRSRVRGAVRIIYFDLRNNSHRSTNQVPAVIMVWSFNRDRNLIKELNRISNEVFGQNIYRKEDLQLSMSSSEDDAQIVAEAIIRKHEQVMGILNLL